MQRGCWVTCTVACHLVSLSRHRPAACRDSGCRALSIPRGTSPHGRGGPGGRGPPLQAQVAVDRAVCRWHVRAESWVVEREERDSSLHWRTERGEGSAGLLAPHTTPLAANLPPKPPHPQSHLLDHAGIAHEFLPKKLNQIRTQQNPIVSLSKPLDPMTSLDTIQGREKQVK